jgi:hypothetical protein
LEKARRRIETPFITRQMGQPALKHVLQSFIEGSVSTGLQFLESALRLSSAFLELYKKRSENERWFLDHFHKKKIINFMVAETGVDFDVLLSRTRPKIELSRSWGGSTDGVKKVEKDTSERCKLD